MADFGNPAGFDIATVLTGSGLTLLISGAILQYGDEIQFEEPALYAVTGAVLAALGVVFGLALVVSGYR